MKRRQFIQLSSAALAATAAIPALTFPPGYRIGLQLYTLRDVIGKDPKNVLKQLSDLGYQDIETYGYNDGMLFGMKSKEFGEYVKSLGMRITSGHYQLGKSEKTKAIKGSILNEWERAITDAKETGQEFMVLAYLNEDERASIEDYKWICEKLNKAGEVCKRNGIR